MTMQQSFELPDPEEYIGARKPEGWSDIVFALERDRGEFKGWLKGYLLTNFHIWHAFRLQAKWLMRRRKHYSARTIIENIRHQSVLMEKEGSFKINNNVAPQFARLFMALYPEAEGFFSKRYNGSGTDAS